jgi:hypothetical protein
VSLLERNLKTEASGPEKWEQIERDRLWYPLEIEIKMMRIINVEKI